MEQSDEYALRRTGLRFLLWVLLLAESGTAVYPDCDVSINEYITQATERRRMRLAEARVLISFLPEYAPMEPNGTEARTQTLIQPGSRTRSASDAEVSVDERSSSLVGVDIPVRGRKRRTPYGKLTCYILARFAFTGIAWHSILVKDSIFDN